MDKYLEKIKLDYSGITGPSGIVDVNINIKFKLVENLQEISFNNLYANLLVKFYNAGIFEKNNIYIEQNVIDKVNKFLLIGENIKASNSSDYKDMRYWVNNIYNKELGKYTPIIFELYRQYMRQFWDDFIKENHFGWLYVDTDMAFVSGQFSLDLIKSINVPFDLIYHEFLYLERAKRYVVADSNNIKIKGYKFQPDKVVSVMKSKMRNKRLDSLLND